LFLENIKYMMIEDFDHFIYHIVFK